MSSGRGGINVALQSLSSNTWNCNSLHLSPPHPSPPPGSSPFQIHKIVNRNTSSVTTPHCHGDAARVWQPHYICVVFMGAPTDTVNVLRAQTFWRGQSWSEVSCLTLVEWQQAMTYPLVCWCRVKRCILFVCIVCYSDEPLTGLKHVIPPTCPRSASGSLPGWTWSKHPLQGTIQDPSDPRPGKGRWAGGGGHQVR